MEGQTESNEDRIAAEIFSDKYFVREGMEKPHKALKDIAGLPVYTVTFEDENTTYRFRKIPVNQILTIEVKEEATADVAGGMNQDWPSFYIHFRTSESEMPANITTKYPGFSQPYNDQTTIYIEEYGDLLTTEYTQDDLIERLTSLVQVIKEEQPGDNTTSYIQSVIDIAHKHTLRYKPQQDSQ